MKDSSRTYKIEVYAPPQDCQRIMKASAEAGAGRVGDYEHCFAVSRVIGYWKPLSSAEPFSGVAGELSEAEEVKIETRCYEEDLDQVLKEIRAVHPYEEPLINVIALE